MRDLKTLRTQKNPQHKFPQEASGTYSKLEFQALSVVVFLFFYFFIFYFFYALFNTKWT